MNPSRNIDLVDELLVLSAGTSWQEFKGKSNDPETLGKHFARHSLTGPPTGGLRAALGLKFLDRVLIPGGVMRRRFGASSIKSVTWLCLVGGLLLDRVLTGCGLPQRTPPCPQSV